jgi:nitrous oxidase accessory protein NosD
MKRIALAQTLIVALLVVAVVGLQPAKATPKTIVVPDDYATISLAIENALEGDTVFVKKGVYQGSQNQTLHINKTISLTGEDAKNTVINLHPPLVPMNIFTYEYMGYLDAIRISANGIKLSGFTIISDGGSLSATGNGTQIIGNNMNFRVSANGYGTQIIGNTLTGIALCGSNQTIAQNIIQKGTDEFRISCVGSYNTITSNRVVGSGGGIYTKGSHNIIHGNSITAESGIRAGVEVNGNENILYSNTISNFVNIGSNYNPESSSNIICGNTITNNLIIVGNNNTFNANYFQGIVLGNRIQDASNNIFYHNNFDFAENEVWFGGEKVFTVWEGVCGSIFLDYSKQGNYYSDYNGSDLNADGIGDTPYVIITKDPDNYHNIANFNIADMVLTDHYPLMTPFDVSSVTMELPEWENAIVLSTSPEPAPSPSATPTPSPTPTPTESPSTLPLSPEATPLNKEAEPSSTNIVAVASGASVATVGFSLFFYFNKRKR